jgi:DNA topoisomerase I
MRLRRCDCSKPGIIRRSRGRGFEYFDQRTGEKVADVEVLDRIRHLVLPPAWRDVWICPYANGHLQAIGTDAAGRRQYRYHDEWRRRKDAEKFDEMLVFARTLPQARAHIREQLNATDELTRERVLATSVRLLDQGFFRVGTEEYTAENDSFGLATIRKEHLTVDGDMLLFEYLAKGGKPRDRHFADPAVADVVRRLKARRGGGPELLAYREDGAWRDVRSGDVNAYIKLITGGDYSAKDFRTWSATVKAAVALASSTNALGSPTGRKRAKSFAAQEVAELLGNTPTVARNSYIDPRVFDRYDSGWTIEPALTELGADVDRGTPAFQGTTEQAVLDLLEQRNDAPTVERARVA